MSSFVVQGGNTLRGDIFPQGAKNEALQVVCATLLTRKKVTIKNIPDIRDVRKLITLLEKMGVFIEKITKNAYTFQADKLDLNYLESEDFFLECSQLRGAVMFLGPLTSRLAKFDIPRPGGDKIGRRKLDTHFLGIQKLGVSFEFNTENSTFSVISSTLQGTDILLEEASITGTANILMAASRANGTTTIYNAACEPYIQNLCKMLCSMGVTITGIGTNKLLIKGEEELKGCTHTVLPDMIEIGSFMALGGVTNSPIRIKNVSYENLGQIPNVFRKMGLQFSVEGDDIVLGENDICEIERSLDGSVLEIYDAPWPGFPPDLLSVLLILAIHAKGNVLIHQKMFESRLFFVDRLIEMGAQIILCDPHRAVVMGLEQRMKLRGITMSSPDIRAGISLLIAALNAKEKSRILNIEQIDRGYESIDKRLNALGANITREA